MRSWNIGLLAALVSLAPACGSVSPLSVDAGRGQGGAAAGGSDGTGGQAGQGSGGSGPCPPNQVWCAGCTPGSGICSFDPCPPIPPCIPPDPCPMVTEQVECDVRTDCHSVFADPGTCGCAAIGCCARFVACATGDRAHCRSGATLCERVAPYCESPAYVVSYVDTCYEGCVRPADCE